MIINIRGTSGSGKSTLVHRFLKENAYTEIESILPNSGWKKPKVTAYSVNTPPFVSYTGFVRTRKPTLVVGSYRTQCGGCDSLSYKGSHDDIESMVRSGLAIDYNVIFEGLTISSTLTRWQHISDEYPGQFTWAFMMTPEEECYERIMKRNGGREPKRDAKGLADYQRKYRGCMNHLVNLKAAKQQVLELTSDNKGYESMLSVLQ